MAGQRKKPTPKTRSEVDEWPWLFLEKAWPWIIRFAGLSIVFWETVFENADRPSLLLLAGGMIGLPEFIKLDRRRTQAGRK